MEHCNSHQTTQDSEANDASSSQPKPSIPRVPQQQQQQQLQHQLVSLKRLIGACKKKDLEKIRIILNEQPELINQRDRYNRNLLHYTVILFKQPQGESFSSQFSCSQSIEVDLDERNDLSKVNGKNDDKRRQREINENLACLNYLLDRCHQKLWWQQDLDGLSLLHLAVISSNNPLVKYIIYEHPYSIKYPLICAPDNERHSPLHWAVITNNLECVKLLINSSAGVRLIHEPDFNGATPLHYATQTNDYPKYRRQLRLMLRNVASDQAAAESDAQTQTNSSSTKTATKRSLDEEAEGQYANRKWVFHHSLEVLEILVKAAQVNIECRDKDKRTPLLWAASSGNRDAVLLLIGAGANPQSCDVNKLGALHCAASHGFTECLESLLSVGKRGSSTTAGLVSERSVNQPDNLNCTPIFYAVLSGNIDCVELLADRGAELDWQDSKGRSAAHFAALKGQLNSLKLLRRRGANLWLANKQGDLPLHYAIKAGRHQVARWLLDHSPYENSVNAINNFGRAPIHLAIQRDDADMLDHLIKRGANLNQLVKVKDRQQVSRHYQRLNSSSSETTTKTRDPPGSEPAKMKAASEYHYETALDMAKKLGYDASLRLLVENGAQVAAQVINGRIGMTQNGSGSNVRSLFDLQSVEGPSPIGFDTSSSSAASPHQAHVDIRTTSTGAAKTNLGGLPKLSRPRPDSLPQSDSSGGSSALSQNSLTSVRGFAARPAAAARAATDHQRHRHHHTADNGHVSPTGGESKPFKGGISYNNERINASIKCKLYDGQHTFPPFSARPSESEIIQRTNGQSRHQSAPTSGQEIITNVNVYTSPCPLAHQQQQPQPQPQLNNCTKCFNLEKNTDYSSKFGSPIEDESAISDGPATDTSCDEANGDQKQQHQQWNGHLPDLQVMPSRPITQTHRMAPFESQQQHQLSSRLPPSQGHEQHLPVILSDREEATTSGETSNDRSPEAAAGIQPLHATSGSRPVHTCSPSCEEPRFDRSDRDQNRPMLQPHQHQSRQQVRSPVGEYIRAPLACHERHLGGQFATKPTGQNHCYESHHLPDFRQVKSKVDSHRPTAACDSDRSRSLSRQAARNKQLAGGQPSRSVSRQTFTRKHRHGSQDSLEFELEVEKSIRKYKQEKRLFEELQGLKRSQIRSGRANEAVLVKRLVENLLREQLAGSNDLLGMDNYTGPYTYESYERFVYDQLRKLSQSNCAKLSRSMREFEHELGSNVESNMQKDVNTEINHDDDMDEFDVEQHRKFLEEDMRADLELRRVIEGDLGGEENVVVEKEEKGSKESELEIVRQHDIERQEQQLGAQVECEHEQEKELSQEPEVRSCRRRSSVLSVGSLSRRSSLEAEKSLPPGTSDDVEGDRQAVDEDTKNLIEDEANSMSSAIMVDALGNLTPRLSTPDVVGSEELQGDPGCVKAVGDSSASNDESRESSSETCGQVRSRRRSVVNIGNKLEVIYHDVGIEIDSVPDPTATDEAIAEERQKDEKQSGALNQTDESLKDRRSEPAIMEDVKEEEDGEKSEPLGDMELDEADSLVAAASQQDKLEEDELDTRRHLVDEDLHQAQKQTSRARTAVRRASSPQGNSERPSSPRSERRMGSIDSSTRATSYVSEIKKVFNGYDLDELHHRRGPRDVAEQATKIDSIKSGPSPVREISPKSVSKSKRPTARRAKRERSRLPEKRFKPRVDENQIRQRWSRVKAVERRRRMDENQGGSLGQVSYFAKSHPNLKQVHDSEQSQTKSSVRLSSVDESNRQNYQLLYEINARSKHESGLKGDVWCQRKVVKIVDVRSLKRTLSLPESVMYSNDLLKRFNILKL